MGQYEKALPLYLEALKYTEKSLGREHSYYGNQLSNLAVLYKVVGEYDKALPLSLQAIENAEKSLGKEHSEYSTRLNNLAGLYEAMGQYDKALPLYLQAIENAEKSLGREHSKYGTLLNNLAGLYKTMGQYEKALPMYLQALDITEKSLGSGHAEYGIRLNNLAGLYEAVGEYEKALPLYLQALDITEKSLGSGHSEYGSHLNNLAGIYKELGQYDKALALYLNALENTDKSLGREHSEYGKFLNNLAGLYETMGQYEKALPLYRESLEITEKGLGKQHSNYSIRLNNLAGLYKTMGQDEKALPLYLEAYQNIKSQIAQQFRFMSENEKEQFLKGVMYYFEIYHSFLLDYPVKNSMVYGFSLDIELTRKSLLLQSGLVMRQAVQQSNDSALLSQYEAWLFAKDLIAKQYGLPAKDRRADLNDMESKAEQMEAELTRKSSALKVALQKSQATWQEVKLSLPEKAIAIELISFNYHNNNAWTDSTLYMAVVLRKSDTMPHLIPLFEQRQLDSLLTRQNTSEQGFVSSLYRGIKTNSSQQDVYQGRKLFELIWKPLDSLLQPGDDIYLAPSGTLHQLAFAAIPYDSPTTLSDRYRLHTVASTAVLLKEKNSTQARTLSVFGGVQFDDSDTTATNANTSTVSRSLPGDLQRSGETWSYLPGTLREAESIATTAKQKGIQVTLFSGKAATEEKLKALTGKNAPDVLHIATHGFFFPDPKEKPVDDGFISDKQETVFKASDNPLNRSGIVLAGANKTWNGAEKPDGREDGILTAYEASYLPLANTKLVVLSACETGLGDVKGSEGVYGLQRAFKQAGAEYLLMSLWKVPDNETAEFMSTFYGHYFGGSPIEDAYLLTQKAMREKYRNDPYKWAAFVLMR
jgi:CHAT domain-containing protein/tetratricopeptide (TPR) repeat protein